jgi:orotate phosphoribosyltransferase
LSDREELKKILMERSILKGDFTLVSGKKSTYYINGKMTTLHSRGLNLSARLLLENFSDLEYDGFAGPVIGADPIIGALLALSAERGEEKEGFLIRKEAKGHGTQKLVEGKLETGMKVIIVEDVVTTKSPRSTCLSTGKKAPWTGSPAPVTSSDHYSESASFSDLSSSLSASPISTSPISAG